MGFWKKFIESMDLNGKKRYKEIKESKETPQYKAGYWEGFATGIAIAFVVYVFFIMD